MQQRIHTLEQNEQYNSKEYEIINEDLASQFTLRTRPIPDCMVQSNNGFNKEIYTAMQGPSEFTMQGVLATINLTSQLHTIQIPVLLSHGAFDTMRPSIVKTMEQELPYGERLFLLKSGHISMIDEPEVMNNAISDFFDRVEVDGSHKRAKSEREKPMIIMADHDKELQQQQQQQQRMQQQLLGVASPDTPAFETTFDPMDSGGFVQMGSLCVTVILSLTIGFILGEFNERRKVRRHYISLGPSSSV